ncbi:unnamed protein product, partial [Ectocarpus sp. 12 AP-2014]
MPIRVSSEAMLALARLQWRLKAAGPRALDALAVLSRLVLGDGCNPGGGDGVGDGGGGGGGGDGGRGAGKRGGSALQAAAYTGPYSLAFVESNISTTSMTSKAQAQEVDTKSREVEAAMAKEARAAARARTALEEEMSTGTPPSAAAQTSSWGPRARVEAAVEAVSEPIKGLSSTYREYAAALAEARVPTITTAGTSPADDDDRSDDNGSTMDDAGSNNTVGGHTAGRSEWFGRDFAAILDRARRKQPLLDPHGLKELALHPPPPPPPHLEADCATSGSPSHPPAFRALPLPVLPETLHRLGWRVGKTTRTSVVSAKEEARSSIQARSKAKRNGGGGDGGGGGGKKKASQGPMVASGVRDNIRLLQMEL